MDVEPVTCNPESEFRCIDGISCIELYRRCDSLADCADGSDEEGCGEWQLASTCMYRIMHSTRYILKHEETYFCLSNIFMAELLQGQKAVRYKMDIAI